MVQVYSNLTASVQALTLNRGLHLVSVTAASPQRAGDDGETMLPAVHVGPGPGVASGQVEILSGPRNDGQWLVQTGDMLVVKVLSGQPLILITTVRAELLPAIAVEVTRLDGKPALAAAPATPPNKRSPAYPSPPSRPLRTASGQIALSARIDLHVQNKGDITYVDNFWAGALGERLAIEAFTITPLTAGPSVQIEYAGVAETGGETGWIEGGRLCGARGAATALVGFAIRPKGDSAMAYDCEYRGAFGSGRIVGPIRNGAPCRSDPGDRLEAIQLFILPRSPEIEDGGSLRVTAEGSPLEPPAAPRLVGPRFGVFRESVE